MCSHTGKRQFPSVFCVLKTSAEYYNRFKETTVLKNIIEYGGNRT